MSYTHPHPDPAHIMRAYRRYILGCKKKFGTRSDGTVNKRAARALIHYRAIVLEYLAAKRLVCRV